MNTLITKIKTYLEGKRTDGTINIPEQAIQKVAPNSIPPLRNDQMPFIGIAPISSNESWITTGKRNVVHMVDLYCAIKYTVQEDEVTKMLELVEDIEDVIRNQKFDDYLSAPAQLSVPNYVTTPYGDNIYLIIATISVECRRVFISS